MNATFREPLELCRPCGQQTHAAWGFCDNDIFCPLCGLQILHIQIQEEITGDGGWVPIGTVSVEKPTSRIHLRAFRSVLDRPIGVADLVPLDEVVDWEKSFVTFEENRIGRIQMHLSLAQVDKPNPEGWVPVDLTIKSKTNDRISLPRNGIPGQLTIVGLVNRIRNAWLLPRPSSPPWFEIRTELLPNDIQAICGYQDELGKATLTIPLTQLDRKIVILKVSGFENLINEEYKKYLIETPFPFLIEPKRNNILKVSIDAIFNPNPATIELNWQAVGSDEIMRTPVTIVLKRLPPLEFEPRSPLLRDVYLGDRPTPIDLLLKTGDSLSQENLRLVEATVTLDPPKGDWLRLDTIVQGLEIPSKNSYDPQPVPIQVTLDTSRLPRQGDQPRDLNAQLIFRDESGTEYPYEIRVKARRLPVLLEPVGLDWGTTNTCMARGDGVNRPAVGIKLSELQDDLERFSSNIFFEDLSVPESPLFHIGDQAIRVAGNDHPECWLRSLKRKFLVGDEVFVRDIKGREWSYPVEMLAKMVILKLIEIAERQLRREIQILGITFPTKWTANARRRFTEVVAEVRKELTLNRSPIQIELYDPIVDEANAVALQILPLGYAARFNRPFTILAYDFGGGTIDTSIVRIEMDPETYVLKTTYLGIGGLGDFGGDEVTLGIVLLLKAKLDKALNRWGGYEILIHRDGIPPSDKLRSSGQLFLDARKNWNELWKFAERIKYRFCDPLTASDNPVKKVLEDNLSSLICHQIGNEKRTDLFEVLQSANADRDWVSFFNEIGFDLKEVCEFPLEEGKTILSQVEDTFLELKRQLVDAGLQEPDLIVLAGGGCRLPLVRDITQKYFPTAYQTDCILYDPKFAKQRVAHGKVTYMNLSTSTNAVQDLGLSVSVLHRPLALLNPGAFLGLGEKANTIIPVGSAIDQGTTPHTFEFAGNQMKKNELPLFVRYWSRGDYRETKLGFFLLKDVEVTPRCRFVGEIRLSRGETDIQIQLWVSLKGESQKYGPFPFEKSVQGPLDEWLQGVWSNTLNDEGV